MRMYLMIGDHADGSGELFSCDWFVQADNINEAVELWKTYLDEEWDIALEEVDDKKAYLVPTTRPAEGSKVICWSDCTHFDVTL